MAEPSSNQPSKAHSERNLFAWSLLVSILLLGAMAGPFFDGRIYTHDDLGATHLPFRAFYSDQLARGEPFDWMPHVFSGFYLTGEGQAGTYHPLHWLLYRLLPLQAALAGEYLATYPFMLVGCYLFLRRRLGRRDASMLGALAFTFSGFNMLHFAHPNAIAIVAHIPWLLWTIDVALTDPNRRHVAFAEVGIALLTGSELLLGYPQYVWFSLLAEAAWAGYLLFVLPKTPHRNPWHRVPIAKACGLLLGGVQLLPTIESLTYAARQAGDASYANWGSLHPGNLIQLIAPYMFTDRVLGGNTHELGVYVGVVPLLLVIWVRIRHEQLGAMRRLTWALVGFGGLALVLSFGQAGQLYRLQRFLPLVGSFRCPCRYLVLFYFAMAALAAIGFTLLLKEHTRHRSGHGRSGHGSSPGDNKNLWHPYRGIWLTVVVGALVAMAAIILRNSSHIGPLPGVLAGPVLLAIGASLIVAAARGSRPAIVGLIVFTAVDLGIYGLSYAVYPRTYRLDQYIAWTPTPPSEPETHSTDERVVIDMIRFDERELHTGNQITLTGWYRAGGYVGLEPKRRLDYRDPSALRVAGVRWVKRGKTTEKIDGLIEHDENWLEVPRPLPKVRLVSQTLLSNDPAADLRRIDVDTTALVEVPLASAVATPPGKSQPGTAEVVEQRPGYLKIRYDCSFPQLLVVSESYHPGWKATVASEALPVLRVNGDFIGCLIEPENDTVVIEFRPGSLRRGWLASCFGLAIVCISFVGCRFQPATATAND